MTGTTTSWIRNAIGAAGILLAVEGMAAAVVLSFGGASVGGAYWVGAVVRLVLSALLLAGVLRVMLRATEAVEGVARGDPAGRLGIRFPGVPGALFDATDRAIDVLSTRAARIETEMRERIDLSVKQAAIGRLAAGVAHEVNNPLTGVLTFAHLLRAKEDLDADDRQSLDVIIRETTRVRDIVRRLLDFARETPVVMRSLDLRDVTREALDLVRGQKDFSRIEIREERSDEPLRIWGDRNRLQQVFLNLYLNAAQAMVEGGILMVTVRRDGDRAAASVADTGPGISAAHRERIFEPFFTTKPVGQGTGLGLSLSEGIVRQHRGTLRVESEPDRGATFIVTLPLAAGEGAPTAPAEEDAGG